MLKNYTPQDIKLAHQIVQEDLLNSLTNLVAGESCRFGKLGKFIKSEHLTHSPLNKGQTSIYGKIRFKPFSKLKAVLNEQIIKKYRLNAN